MNFLQIRTDVGNEIQHSPDSDVHRADLRSVVNRVHRDLILMHPWTFRWMKARFATYPDLRVGEAHWDRLTSRAITIDNFTADYFQYGADRLLYALQGNFAVFRTYDSYGAQRFLIERAALGTGTDLTLDPRWVIGGKIAAGSWTLRFERFPLPADCMGVLGVAQVDAATGSVRPLGAWSPTDNQGLIRINPDTTGPSQMWLMDIPGFSGPTNKVMTLPSQSQATPFYGGGEPDLPRPPALAPTVVQSAANAGVLKAGVEYEVGYTWSYGNRESGMSQTSKVTLEATAFMSIEISGLEILPDDEYGRSRIVYFREADLGRWHRIDEILDPTIPTSSYLGDESFDPMTMDVRWEEEPCNEWIRLYPRPDDFMEHELTYLRRPRMLQKDEDVPDFPTEFHALLVHAALLDLQSRHSGFKCAAFHQESYNAALGRMRSRYLETVQLEILVKGNMLQIGRSAFSQLVPPYTTPNVEG